MQTKFTELTDYQWQFIKKHIENHHPRKHCLRAILNAIFWITRTGSQWRNLESRYPPWESVYYYFRQWKDKGILSEIMQELVEAERIRQGKERAPSVAAVDSQSCKKSPFVSLDTGLDAGKKVNGRKRHLLVDTLGLPLAIHVSAADMSDAEGGYELLWQTEQGNSSRLELIRADQAYAKLFKQAASYYNWQVDTTQRPPSQKGFIPEKGRWQVERSFAWGNFYRRLSRSYEKSPESEVAFIQLMFINIILTRIDQN
jgi:transposase